MMRRCAGKIEKSLFDAMKRDVLQDAVIAENESQAQRLVLLRENIVEAQQFEGGSIKHDIAVPVAAVPEFLRRTAVAIKQKMPDARLYPYGHMGDGNMHFNITQPTNMDTKKFLANWKPINEIVHEITHQLNGSFSAEHGIGIAKLDEMKRYKDPVTLALYQQVKQAFDPNNIMNPGKVNPA